MRLTVLLGVATLCLPALVDAQASSVNRNRVWFKPYLTVDSEPVCKQLLQVEQDAFFSTGSVTLYERTELSQLRAGMPLDTLEDPQVEPIDNGIGQLILTLPDRRRVFVYFERTGGCHGRCEGEQVRVSDKPFERQFEPREARPDAPAVVGGWRLFKSPKGDFYTIATVQGRMQAYRVAAPAGLELACEVRVRPAEFESHRDAAVRKAWRAVEALGPIYRSMAHPILLCGTPDESVRVPWNFQTRMEDALSRPWAAVTSEADELDGWSLIGVAERRSYHQYRQQLDRSAAEIGKFYQSKFGWPASDAKQLATNVLRTAFHSGFSFPSEDPWPRDLEVRRAILDARPMSEIRALSAKITSDPPRPGEIYDSVLNVAIEYPEALRYLLDQGLDPNAANEFGKTALMYAAQYNQIESVRILLAAGADPNAKTHIPEYDCSYALQTSDMTPLHYAARYADAALIRLLVAEGAVTFSETWKKNDQLRQTPLDWLKKYTGASTSENTEKNPRIAASEVPALVKLLAVPNYMDRQRFSSQLTTRAQAEYARGEYRRAYQHLKIALTAEPDNAKALADLPLMAEKVGDLDVAIPAVRRAIDSAPSVEMRAAAWFNLGRLCAQRNVLTEEQCDPDWIEPFIQAWRLQPTRGRANTLKDIFNRGAGSCVSAGPNIHQKVWSLPSGQAVGRVQRVYVLHRLADPMEISSEQLRLEDRITLDDVVITVLEGPPGSPPPTINGNPCTMPSN